jgi:hypothetical protein
MFKEKNQDVKMKKRKGNRFKKKVVTRWYGTGPQKSKIESFERNMADCPAQPDMLTIQAAT